ncbi:predicted protein [Coccidioides posadasii str. Silveira]|uniref:Predicted protein n=2 Tax=Coccidioides posadasii TaxID=199306 RepID=E9DC54_COCPS|nr:predicted protein [Coccidioides posadasii str. Silveira]KMM69087.1 hypothetical protein CPAG_05410 [Coccidioides posadasii RMSCC 3488]
MAIYGISNGITFNKHTVIVKRTRNVGDLQPCCQCLLNEQLQIESEDAPSASMFFKLSRELLDMIYTFAIPKGKWCIKAALQWNTNNELRPHIVFPELEITG